MKTAPEVKASAADPEDRAAIIEQIAKRQEEKIAYESTELPADEPDELDEPEEEEDTEKEDAEPKDEPEPEDAGPVEEDAEDPPAAEEPMVTVIVDGDRKSVPLSEVTKSYQISQAATRRLQEATLTYKEVQALKAELESLKATQKVEPEKAVAPDELLKERRAIEFQMFQASDQEEFAKLQERRDALDEKLLLARIQTSKQHEVMEQQRRAAQAAHEKLVSEVAKVHADWEDLTMVKNPHTGEPMGMSEDFGKWLQQQPARVQWGWMESGDPRDPIDVLKQYKEYVKPVADLSARREKKRTIDVVEAQTQRVKAPEPKQTETDREYVQRLRKERSMGRGSEL